MIALQEQLFTELNALVADLGKDGGQFSPAIYDTAQLLRLYPPPQGVDPALDWLISQQKSDGGWGDPAVPTARDVPTLAAILAIFAYRRDRTSRQIVNAGLEFLESQAEQWVDAHIDLLPIAVEMILPYLIKEACDVGLCIDQRPYMRLFTLREQKLNYIQKKSLVPGSAPTFSWEALGLNADVSLLDGSGGVGHSPAATAAWLRSASKNPELQDYIPIAERYLDDAAKVTGVDIPGVLPNAYPVLGFEIAYSLYALHVAGLIDHPILAENIERQGRDLHELLKIGNGISLTNFFVPDVDCTSTAVIALRRLEYPIDSDYVWRFQNGEHFYTYKNELNPSVLSNAHALNALTHCGEHSASTEEFLLQRQEYGHWLPDKWHSSWRFTTMETIFSMLGLGYEAQIQNAVQTLMNDQHSDGGWGMSELSSTLETTYCTLALKSLHARGELDNLGATALANGYRYLTINRSNEISDKEMFWLCKELYAPYRIDRIYTLSTILAILQSDSTQVGEHVHA